MVIQFLTSQGVNRENKMWIYGTVIVVDEKKQIKGEDSPALVLQTTKLR